MSGPISLDPKEGVLTKQPGSNVAELWRDKFRERRKKYTVRKLGEKEDSSIK